MILTSGIPVSMTCMGCYRGDVFKVIPDRSPCHFHCEIVPLSHCTIVGLYHCTIEEFHNPAIPQSLNPTFSQSHILTILQSHDFTMAQSHNATIRQRSAPVGYAAECIMKVRSCVCGAMGAGRCSMADSPQLAISTIYPKRLNSMKRC